MFGDIGKIFQSLQRKTVNMLQLITDIKLVNRFSPTGYTNRGACTAAE